MPQKRKLEGQPDHSSWHSLRIKKKEVGTVESKRLKHPKRSEHKKPLESSSSTSASMRRTSLRLRRSSSTRSTQTTNKSTSSTTRVKKEVTRSTTKAPSVDTERRKLKPLQLGDKLPNIILKNELGEDVYIQNIADQHPVIIFAYPKASTPGCTVQGCGFRDQYATIQSKNYHIYGLSMDSPNAQMAFKTKQNFPYHLLSDPKAELISALGASKSGFKIARSHWIFKKGGVLFDMKIGVSPKDSVERVIAKISE